MHSPSSANAGETIGYLPLKGRSGPHPLTQRTTSPIITFVRQFFAIAGPVPANNS